MTHDFQADIDAISHIEAVATILDVVCRTTGMGFAAVARVTEDRWIACKVLDHIQFGLEPGGELAVRTTLCGEIRQSGQPVIIDHVAEDKGYAGHPTPAMYGFQSYISMPIVLADGSFFGTLCAIDPRPARLNNPETIGMFRLFAELIAFHLRAQQQLAASAADLAGERKVAELREQFVAVLGHDLRNPLSSISAGMNLLERTPLDPRAQGIVVLVRDSVARMAGLIDNVLDFARGRLGGGIGVVRDTRAALEPVLDHVVRELQAVWPDRAIETRFALPNAVACDSGRIAQMLSNLLANALTHGAEHAPVRVDAETRDGRFVLSVANEGPPIPAADMEHLFEPFTRGRSAPHKDGLGLGLYIAAEIARAHGGTLVASSTAEETRFTFSMPLA